MKFPTYLVGSRAAKMSPEAATYLGELEYAEWPIPKHAVVIDGKLHTVVGAPANIPRGPKVLVMQGSEVLNDDEPKLHVYVVESS